MNNHSDSEIGVSIIIPAAGRSTYLLDALNSAIAQETAFPFEIILILQDVPKDLVDTLGTYSLVHKNVRIMELETASVTKASNLGISKARYKYIARLDSDDLINTNRIDLQLRLFLKQKNLVLVGSSARTISQTGELIGHIRFLKGNFMVNFFAKYLCVLPHSSAMFLRDVALRIGGYDESFDQGGEDFNLWSRLSREGKIHIVGKSLLDYRVHPDQVTYIRTSQQLTNDSQTILSNIRRKFNSAEVKSMVQFLQSMAEPRLSVKWILIFTKSIFRYPDLFLIRIFYKFLIFFENLF